MMTFEARRSAVNFSAIPVQLQKLPNWAFYTKKKAPIQISAVARNWPIDGWNDGLIDNGGNKRSAGAKSNDHTTWGLFDDCCNIYSRCVTTGDRPASKLIAGPTFALQEELGIVVIDLDDPLRSLKDKRNPKTGLPHTPEEIALLVKAAQDSQSIVLRMFQGHYIERSASGNGYHIFVFGKLPHARYQFSFHGSVFCSGQFINMTGDVENLGTWTSYSEAYHPEPSNVVDMDGHRPIAWRDRAEPITGPVVSGHMQDGQAAINEFNKYFSNAEVGLLLVTNKDVDTKAFEEGELFETDYCKYGRRNDLSDDEVVAKLSRGMQAVYAGGSISGDYSEDTYHLLGDLEKITGCVEQIERLMKKSPRMIGAGIGNDGQSRWQKTFRLFNRNLAKARQANDNKFKEWASKGTLLSEERRTEMRDAFAKLTSADDPNSIAYKAAQAVFEAQEREEKVKAIHVEMLEKFPRSRKYTGTAQQAMEQLACGIDPAYLGDVMPPGRMSEFCYYVHEGMYEPYMKFAIPATFTALAGIVARKYKLRHKDGEAISLHAVLLGKSAVGKTQAFSAIEAFQYDLRREINFKNRFDDRDISSKQGFHEILQSTPSLTWVKDECAPLLRSIISPVSNDPNSERLRAFTNQLFDYGRAEKDYHPTASVSSQKREDHPIKNLCVSIFWGSTQANVKDYFTTDAVHTGIISRMIFINHPYAGGVYKPGREQLRALPQGDLREVFKQLLLSAEQLDKAYIVYPDKESPEAADPENPGSLMQRPRDLLVPVVMDDQAQALYVKIEIAISAFKQEIHNEISDFPDYYIALARTAQIVARMAGVMAVIDNPNQPIIRYEMIAWALGYVLNATCGVLSSFETLDLGGVGMASAARKAMLVYKKLSMQEPWVTKKHVMYGRFKNYLMQNSPFRDERNPKTAVEETIFDLVDDGILALGGNTIQVGTRSTTASVTKDEGKIRPGVRGCYVLMTDHEEWSRIV